MDTIIYIILIISLILAIVIVNKTQQVYMKIIGAEFMFFNTKKKLIAICIVCLVIASIICKVFGIEI